MIAGGGVVLLLLAWVYSWMTSGPAVVSPTLEGGTPVAGSNPSSGAAPVPNQGSDTIQTGETNSSVARANRTRSAAGAPRRADSSATAQNDNGSETTPEPSRHATSGDESPNTSTVASTAGNEKPDGPPVTTDPLASIRSNESGVKPVPAAGSEPVSSAADSSPAHDDKLFPVESVPIPKFPRLGTPRASTISGVVFHEISVGNTRSRPSGRSRSLENGSLPGGQMDMILYLPSGAHQPASLPCVLIAAAGTSLLEGNGCFDESYQSETIPYVKQGFAVLGYSLDGPLSSDKPSNQETVAAYQQFRDAHAGLVNARNALEFVLQQVPAVDPKLVFTAGHSSAGTLALLFAEHESRLAGCIAYAPCVDVEKRLSDYSSNPRVQLLLPDIEAFVRQESPLTHVKSLNCPVFLFHAEGDSNAPISESQALAARLTTQGTLCQLETVPDGDHYDSMLEEGIPRGIAWLKRTIDSERAATPAPQ